MSPKLSSNELQAIVARQIANSSSATDISAERAELFDRYMAEPYGDEVENRSSVVSTDISDVVEWIMPELMEIFTSGDKVVSFEPIGQDDEEKAEQETDVVNHVFTQKNDGFLILYSFFKDALIQKVGYVKRWWDERETTVVEEYEGLSPDQMVQMHMEWEQEGSEVEYLSHSEEPNEAGEIVVNCKARITSRSEMEKVAPVPPEELIVAARWNSIFLDKCPFVAHKQKITVSDLIEQDYDRKQVEGLGAAADEEFTEERVGRFDQRGSTETSEDDAADASMTEVLVHECYLRVDYDGDGIAELRKVTVGGSGHEILRMNGKDDNEEVASIPFSSLTPIIVPHRHFGRCPAELVADLQKIKTMLQRNVLDNFYANNNPTREIAEDGIGENTIEDLLVDRPGKIVRTAMPGMYVEHAPKFFGDQALALIEYMDTVRENRTGVSRLAQGLDANTINKTAKGQAQLMSAAQKKIALIARIFAETGVKDLFRGIHDDLRRNATKAMTVRLRNEWVEVDPRHWRNRADLTVNVALGVGNAEQQMQKLMIIADKQEQNLLNGSPLVTPDNLHHTYTKMVGAAGFKNPDAFFTGIDPNAPPKEPPPDPEMVKVQGQLEMQKMKMQGEAALRQQDAELDREGRQDELALQREKMHAEMQLEREKMTMQMALERWKAEQEIGIKREVAAIQATVAHRNNEMKDETAREKNKAASNGA